MRVIRRCTAATAYAVTLACLLCLAQQTTSQCVDVDQKAFNVSGTNLTQTTRDKLSDLGYYCDITLSWNVSNSTVFDQSKHDAAFALYQKLYAQATADSIEGERKSGITKDCLAFSYKVFCAYTIPKCSNGADVETVYQEPRPLQLGLQHAAVPLSDRSLHSSRKARASSTWSARPQEMTTARRALYLDWHY